MRYHTLVAASLVLAAAAGAQPSAQSATAPTSPPRRAHHMIAFDDTRQRVILTAGSTPVDSGRSYVFFDDLWEFDGQRWTPREPSGAKLSGVRLAFDLKRGRMFSFGGYIGGRGSLGDLRVLENGAWRTVSTLAEMPAAEPGFVYDALRDRFVAFGGSGGRGAAHGDTWEWDGERWTKLAVDGPPARQGHAMVYDGTRGRTIVFGGMGAGGGPGQRPPLFGDTWEFDGREWKRLDIPGPSPRAAAGIAFDSRRGLVLLFGGMDGQSSLGDTWAWDGRAWRKLADDGPPPRSMGALAYDRRRDRVVLFGGRGPNWPDGDLNDTWEWDGQVWRRVAGS